MKRKILSTLLILVLMLTFSLMTAVPAGAATTFTRDGSTISVDSLHLCEPGAETADAFNNEPETLVVDGVAFDGQTCSQVTIEGEVSDLYLGAGWVDTAYVEIGLRPEATMTARNAGIYLIALNGVADTQVHLQDYTGGGRSGGVISITKDADFRYRIRLETSGSIGGTANLEVWVGDVSQGTATLPYGYASTWQENVAGALNEDFSSALLFYSIIADRRGVEGETYSATVGAITVDDTLYVGLGKEFQFNTIQAAIDFANPGDTIKVAAGEYAGAIINQSVILVGAADGSSVITSGVPYKEGNNKLTSAFRPEADGAEIRNFTIDCGEDPDLGVYAVEVDGVTVDSLIINTEGTVQGITNWGGSNWVITNNVITNTVISGGGGIGIFLGAKAQQQCAGNLIQYNEINATATAETYSTPGICLSLDTRYGEYDLLDGKEDVSGNQILDNTITSSGVESSVGIEVGTILGNSEDDPDRIDPVKIAAIMAAAAVRDNVIQGNTIDGAETGVYFYNVTGLTFTYNEITNSVENGIYVEHGHNGIAVNYNNIYGNAYGLEHEDIVDVDYGSIDAENNWWGSANGPEHAGNTFNVGFQGAKVSDYVDYVPWLDGPYPGGNSFAPVTLNPAPGQFFSSIQAAINAATHTTITCAAGTFQEGDLRIDKSLTIQGAGRSSTTTIDATGKNAGFYIDANDVTIKDLIVKNSIYRNITVYSKTVSNVTIDNVASLDSLASGLEVHQGTVTNLVINNCLFSGNGLHGLRVDSAGVIHGMTITDSHFDGNDAGMTIYKDTDNVVISNSTFNNNVAQTGKNWTGGYGIYIGNANGYTATNTDWLIDNCQFKDNHYDHADYTSGLTETNSIGISLCPYNAGFLISNMTISNSEFSGNQELGLEVHSAVATDISHITVEYCDFIGMVFGIRLTGAGATDFQVHYCNFDGNTNYGIFNSSPIVDATNNWWGHKSGPHASPGQGAPVSGDVIYNPWLIEPLLPGQPLPTTFDTTLCLNIGWTLVSTDNWVSANETVGEGVILALNFTPSLGWFEVNPEALVPVDALYLKTEEGGALGIIYSGGVPAASSKDLEAGWNLISSATVWNAKAVLSPLRYVQVGNEQGIGLATVVSQGGFNQHTASFYLATLTPSDWMVLGTTTLNPFDGYWVYMNAGKSFGVVPGH